MERSFRSGLILLAGLTVLAAALAVHAILLEAAVWTLLLALVGAALTAWGAFQLRGELGAMLRGRRGEIALTTIGVIGVLVALAHLSLRFPMRWDMTETGRYSLSDQTVGMLKRLEKPVHVIFFHDPMMRETVELYELMAAQTDKLTLEFFDPMLNPAQARMLGVEFAGTSLMQSEDRKLQIHGGGETDIANGILRVSQGARQRVCFLDGHGEPDPFSTESHDHLEGAPGHTHGLGSQYVLHERHGMAKARGSLEAMNYVVEKLSLLRGGEALSGCLLLIVAGPATALLPNEVEAVRRFLSDGGNAFFMLDPFVRTGLEPLLRDYGIVLDETIVVDEASHFWADMSSPAVSSYYPHMVTRELPLSFFPGVRSLSPTPNRVPGTTVTPLANSSRDSWAQTERSRVQFKEGRDVRGPNTLMAVAVRRPVTPGSAAALPLGPQGTSGERKAVALESVKAASRIAVVGDSDFATNSFFHLLGNGKLFLNTVNYLTAQENLIGVAPRTYDLPQVNLTNRQMKGTFFLAVILIPALLAVVGTAVWWKQR